MAMAFGQSSHPMPATADTMVAMGITAAGNNGVMGTGVTTITVAPADIVTRLLQEPTGKEQTGSVPCTDTAT